MASPEVFKILSPGDIITGSWKLTVFRLCVCLLGLNENWMVFTEASNDTHGHAKNYYSEVICLNGTEVYFRAFANSEA